MNKKTQISVGVAYLIASICTLIFAINNTINSIAYGIDTGDAKMALLKIGIGILPVMLLVFLGWFLEKKLRILPISQ